ncbi:MAG: hypothetical protein ACTTJC_02010 [Campylobacter sp.]
MKTLAQLVYEKTKWNLKDYSQIRGLRGFYGLRSGYVSKANARILEQDGIDWRSAKNAKIAGGSCAVATNLNKEA